MAFQPITLVGWINLNKMFSPGTDMSQDASGVVLIPTRFVWPHGGKRVFLTGTFTRFE